MSDTPFTTIGDEPVEARIVAWVLGEASAFEAAELERLCDERPELMIFKRRMLALHSLLAEAEKPQTDESWKLPPEKRKAVDEILGDEKPIRLEVVKEKRSRRSATRVLLAIAACLVLLVVIGGLTAPMAIRQRKKSDVTEARSRKMQMELAALEAADEMQPLRTELPSELIEGTPKPMNVPNLESPVSGPAGSGSWRSDVNQLAQNEKGRSRSASKSATSPRPSTAPSVRRVMAEGASSNLSLPEPAGSFEKMKGASDLVQSEMEKSVGGVLAQREPRLRVKSDAAAVDAPARPSDFAMKTESEADPFADEGVSTSRLAARRELQKTGSGTLSMSSGGGGGGESLGELAESTAMNNRAGGTLTGKGSIDGISDNNGSIAGEKELFAEKKQAQADLAFEPAGVPVLGDIFANDDKSDLGGDSRFARNEERSGSRTYTLSGDNTYAGGSTVSGGTLGIGGSAGHAENAPARFDRSGAVGGDVTRTRLLADLDAEWEESAPADQKTKESDGKEGFKGTVNSGGPVANSQPASGISGGREFQHPTESEPPKSLDLAGANSFFDKSIATEAGKETAKFEYKLQVGNEHEHLFRGADIAKDGDSLPVEAAVLAKAIRDQEDKVEERRKVLATIVRTKGIIYKGKDSTYNQGGVDEDQGARDALQTFHQIEQEKAQLEKQLGAIEDEGGKQTSAEADNRKAVLKAQLDLATNRLKSVEAMKDDAREEAIKRGLDAQDYADAKREFEQDQALLQQMKLKLKSEKPVPPKIDLTKLMEEIAAAQEPYSTFSLNISDASFQIARAAMAKGERPDPAGIKVEQFYNAVDYGDPSPSANEPVAVSIEQAAHPVIPGRNLVRIALKTAAAGRSAAQPLRLTLLVDQSGSMTRADRRAAMDTALAGLSKLLTKNDLVSVIGFSRTPRLLADGMTGDKAEKLAELVNQAASEGGTNLEEAIKLGEQLAGRQKLASAQNRIVLFTDGAANLGNADPGRLAEQVKQLRQKGIAFDIAGIAADGLNDELLGELARNGNGRYYVVGKGGDDNFAKQLAGAFRPAAENVKVQVRFNPERVGRYKLIGFEKDRLKTEDFRNDKVDAAELAAEEAGVAIYQVEPLAEGHGELGEVSVRFRDTATNEMVERTWTISHDSGAPAIDRATPSMQLATLAMLAGEKLKGGPLGEAIDFKQLAEAQANVKQFFGGNARVAEVLRMVDALK